MLVVSPGSGRLGGVPGGRLGLRGRGFLLGGRVAGRHCQPQHVGAHAGVPLRKGRCQIGDRRRQHRLLADDSPQGRERAGVVARVGAGDHETVDVLAREPDLHPRPRPRRVGHRLGHGVVEGAVEVGQRHVDQHPRHRVDRRDRRRRRLAGPGRLGLGLRLLDRSPHHAGQQLGLSWLLGVGAHGRIPTSRPAARSAGVLARSPRRRAAMTNAPPEIRRGERGDELAVRQTAAAALRASARSVRSQVNSGSSRPKWPYDDVSA